MGVFGLRASVYSRGCEDVSLEIGVEERKGMAHLRCGFVTFQLRHVEILNEICDSLQSSGLLKSDWDIALVQ